MRREAAYLALPWGASSWKASPEPWAPCPSQAPNLIAPGQSCRLISPQSLGWAQVQGRDLYSVNYWCPSHSCAAQHNGILLFLSSFILEAKAKCFNFTLFLT